MKLIFAAISLFFAVTAAAQFKKANLQALGLTCAMCSNAITKSLKTLPFVEKVEVDLKSTSYTLYFKEGADIDFDQVRKKVESAGFTVGTLKITAVVENLLVKADGLAIIGGKVFHFVGATQQVLSGEQEFLIVNKYFVSLKDARKYQTLSRSELLKTEKAGARGAEIGVAADARVYNVVI